jgi:DNA recombination protein RmuC
MSDVLLLALAAITLAALGVAAFALPARIAAAARAALAEGLEAAERGLERLERAVRDDAAASRVEVARTGEALREELRLALKDGAESTLRALALFGERLDALGRAVDSRLDRLTASSEKRIDSLRDTVDGRLGKLAEENAARLERIRQTVDEQLQGTLDKRLGEAFASVSERLEAVHRGLGEMQVLAQGVGDLKKVLGNVKTRGTFGEVQLAALLEQILTPDQYAANVAPRKESGERVEFAIRMPGRGEGEEEVLLPIDAKFPTEDYQRLVDASEAGDAAAVEAASKALEARLKACARDIRDKYLAPPRTTDFAILFLPTEGLYAEALRRPGLIEALARDCSVTLAGPTTLAAILSSLRMGFSTLAIQKRSSEVWSVLGSVKAEFGKLGIVLDQVEKKLNEASNKIGEVRKRGRAIDRKLRDVQALPGASPQQPVLSAAPGSHEPEEEEELESERVA